ncbi:hypothetical protein GCM10012275_22710 [Longimycelium tulufanense]|uniref:Uncharacterized protein n=1 Tax=Longimycelium tulufanense TaxID=907463 RepID=A0A8J3CDC7_9PSEU|nr:hypothetical protein [Longimycelium tulufanense]GGM51246.1 hypothetical protein GCM10012275_22710 [Longimycelium tulufanense]
MSVVDVGDNWSSGAGIVDTFNGLVQTIEDESATEGEKALGVAVGVLGSAADVASFAMNPLSGLLSAGVGWLLEHVSFLREPLDRLMGDPVAIQATTDEIRTIAREVLEVAEQHRTALFGFQGWDGAAAESFRSSMDRLSGEMSSLAKAVGGAGTVVSISGNLVVTLREIMRDLISTLIGELITGALVAAATAVFTFGASIAGYIGYAVGRATTLAAKIGAKIAKLTAALARQGARLGQLGEIMSRLVAGLDRFASAANAVQQAGSAAEGAEGVAALLAESADLPSVNPTVADPVGPPVVSPAAVSDLPRFGIAPDPEPRAPFHPMHRVSEIPTVNPVNDVPTGSRSPANSTPTRAVPRSADNGRQPTVQELADARRMHQWVRDTASSRPPRWAG